MYIHDPSGRITAVNEPGGARAPCFHLVRTAGGNRWRVRADLPRALQSALDELLRDEPVVEAFEHEPAQLDALTRAIAQAGDAARTTYRGPAFAVPEVEAPRDVVRVTKDRAALLECHLPDWLDHFAAHEPTFAVVLDGHAVSICQSARRLGRATEASVRTIEGYQGRGYAKRVVAAWATAIRKQDSVPLYSTSWENLASRAVARALGMRMYGEDCHVG